ncbi:DUF1380 family protein [Pantoea ananatis]|uniref:DUF1380 family protein n=1 Tax=Pantoea ananas TaxID=553 RepID=UPI00235EAF41|nr:DUF1380 family protein [Pantoea ananatis]
MYGTVSQLCHRLKTEFQGEEKITLIIWRKEDVMKVLSDDPITEETAAEIVCDISTWDRDAQHEAGVGAETVRFMASAVRHAAARRHRPVTVTASDLAVLAEATERLLNTGGDEDPSEIEEALRRAYHAINQ